MLGSSWRFLLAAALFLESSLPLIIAQDCPLDFSWANYTLISSICTDQMDRTKCCRYINALVAVSVSRYASSAGTLGVPPDLTDTCLSALTETLISEKVPPIANSFCALGVKIGVVYQCQGMNTIPDITNSPNFGDVLRSCDASISMQSGCKKCLNSGLSYLRHLMGEEQQDNVTLNTCRNAAFVAVANQGNNLSAADVADCFFSVQGLSPTPVNLSVPPASVPVPASAPVSVTAKPPAENLIEMPVKNGSHKGYKLTLVHVIGIIITGLSVLFLVILILLICRKNRLLKEVKASDNLEGPSLYIHKGQDGTSMIFHRFSYKEIKRATSNFNTVLGRVGNGVVYKGQLDDGSKVAIKCIVINNKNNNDNNNNNNMQKHGEENEFCREMEILGRLHHRHLVALRGFYFGKNERFLVYEYMENGSLKDHLYSTDRGPLTWQTRIRIAIDVANALEYLHYYCDPPLCHGDIKPSNILLDSCFLAKVTDFGLAQLSTNLKIHGTPGYIDPEYLATHELTAKSDVYSYGMLLLELVTAKPATQNDRKLLEWVPHLLSSDDSLLHDTVDPIIVGSVDFNELRGLIEIAHWCTQKEGRERPSMKQVVRALSERWDPMHSEFERAVGEEEGQYCNYGYKGGERLKGKEQSQRERGEVIAFSGDARCLQSSSSTSRSYCSRSVLLGDGNCSPESPRGIFLL